MGDQDLNEALDALDAGHVVVFPTETVFGLGARLDRPEAIEEIFALKGRDRGSPLQVLLSSTTQVDEVAVADGTARRVVEAFMPGPLTLVLPVRPGLPDLGGDGATVGVRVPDHDVTSRLVSAAGPLAATSANLSGRPTPSDLDGVRAVFGEAVGAYVDGPVGAGTPSTVVSLVGGAAILRAGAIDAADLEAVLGKSVRT